MAAPIASQVLGEVLPYLEIKKDNELQEQAKNKVVVPNIEGLTVSDAQDILKNLKLNLETELINQQTDKSASEIITQQIPVSGVEVFEESTIIAK